MTAHLIIVLFSLIVFACVSLFLVLLLRPEAPSPQSESELRETIAGLSAVANAQQFNIVFGDADYQKLRSKLELKPVCAKFRRDRRRIALLWLGELEKDVRVVWEFRRFLVRNGLPVTFRQEAAIGVSASFALFYLKAMRLSVFFCGPFVFSGAVRGAKAPVERLSSQGTRLLVHAPASMRAQLQQRWTQHVLAWNLG